MHTKSIHQVAIGRRAAVGALAAAGAGLLGRFLRRTPQASAHPTGAVAGALDSDALGQPRTVIEAAWGPGTGPLPGSGHYFDLYELYAYPVTDAVYHVAYRRIAEEQIAVYVQVTWLGDGVTEAVMRASVATLIPADARLTDLYWAPPTPDGPIAFSTYRYVSETLGSAYNGELAPEILVILHEVWGPPSQPDGTQVNAVSIMVRERTQATP